MLLTLLRLTQIYLLQVFVLKTITTNHPVPTKSRRYTETISITLIRTTQRMLQRRLPTTSRIVPDLTNNLLFRLVILRVVFHTLLPLSQSLCYLLLLHLFLLNIRKLFNTALLVTVNCPRLLRNHKI